MPVLSIATWWQFWETIQSRREIISGIRVENSRISECRIGRRFARDNTDFATRAIHKRCDNMLCSRAKHLRWKTGCKSSKVRSNLILPKTIIKQNEKQKSSEPMPYFHYRLWFAFMIRWKMHIVNSAGRVKQLSYIIGTRGLPVLFVSWQIVGK